MEQKFDSATNELEIFGNTLTVELSGDYFFYPRKKLRGPCIAISETGVFCCNNGEVCTELPLTEENYKTFIQVADAIKNNKGSMYTALDRR